MSERICENCGFWSQWLPNMGDCMLQPYVRHNAMLHAAPGAPTPPEVAAIETVKSETCAKWAPLAEVRDFAGGGPPPPAWSQAKEGAE